MHSLTVIQDHPPNDPPAAAPPPAPPKRRNDRLGLRYGAMNYVGEFRVTNKLEHGCGSKFVVQTDRGMEIAAPLSGSCGNCGPKPDDQQVKQYVDNSGGEFYQFNAGKVLRVASPDDLHEHELLNARIKEELAEASLLAAQIGLDMKLITAEHLLGGERIVFYFRAETRIDFRQLVKELAHRYQTRIEMRQVGARDEARLVADWEICGRECCCKNFLKKLRPVSMRMAKLQKSTLDPSKVSGRCGRLRCCLRYEQEGYEELNRALPRRNTRVMTAKGVGTVVDRQVLTQLLLVRTEDGETMAFPLEEIEIIPKGQEPPPRPREEQAPERRPARRTPPPPAPEAATEGTTTTPDQPAEESGEEKPRRRRRGRRGGRRNQESRQQESKGGETNASGEGGQERSTPPPASDDGNSEPRRRGGRRRRRRRKPSDGGDGSGSGADAT
jgi:cell fate regulator YaaT (PSP1 superfamily)